MLTIKDQNQNAIGQLENAFNIGNYERRANQLSSFSFSLPKNDDKNDLCNQFNYVQYEGETGYYDGLYRIMPRSTKKKEQSVTYKCQHVLSTLLGDVIDGYLEPLINRTTRENLERLLDLQETKHWVLGSCEFTRYFQYSFSNENGLLAPIFSIAEPLDEPFLFTTDTTVYPWVLNLIRPSDEVQWDMVWGRDMGDFEEVSDPHDIVNRIYPKGAGEGVNQLSIEDVNNGVSYLEDTESIEKYGLQKYIWIDRRFTVEESLKASAQSLLNQWKQPKISIKIDSVDLSVKEEFKHLNRPFYTVGNIEVGEDNYQARIVGEKIKDLTKEWDVQYQIENKLDDIATIQHDVERKIEVNTAYSQGTTNLLNDGGTDNADPLHPIEFLLRIPKDAIYVNFVELTWRTSYFRAYSQATKGGGSIVDSTSSGGGTTATSTSGGGTTATSSSGGGTSTSTESGGSTSQTSSSAGTHRHRVLSYVQNDGSNPDSSDWQRYIAPRASDGSAAGLVWIKGASGNIFTDSADGEHSHSVSVPAHTHNFSVPNHTHSVTIPNHSHEVTIPNHSHSITLPNHVHDIEYGIYEHNSLPSSLEIKVDGNVVPVSDLQGENLDISSYLQKDSNGDVQRDRYATIQITPSDELARITATFVWGVFIQSHKGEKM